MILIWTKENFKKHQEPHLSSSDPSGWDGGLPQSWWGSWRLQNLLRTSILTPEYHQTSSGTPSVLLRSIVWISTHRWTKFKRTNFLIDTLFCPTLKTPSGYPDNRSWSIWPQKQPLSRAYFRGYQPTLIRLGVTSHPDGSEEDRWGSWCFLLGPY